MRTKLTLLLVVLLPLAARGADDLSTALQKGLFEEEANQNLPAAIKAYESLLAASDEQRKLAATALFRLGECYRKLGKTNDAVAQYQRLLRDYADQGPLATLSRQNLVGLGVGQTPMSKTDQVSASVSAEAEELARTERILVQLSGRDLGQVRRLLPTVAPDADFEQYDRLLTEAQEKARTLTGEARDEWRKRENEYTHLLERRFDQIKGLLTERAEQLRVRVAVQKAEAGRRQSNDQEDPATNRAQKAEAAQAEALLKQLKMLQRSELLRVLPTAAPDPLLNSLLEKLAEAQAKLASARTTFTDDHPTTKSASEGLKVLALQIEERLDGILKGLEIKAATLNQQAAATTGSVGDKRAVLVSEEEQEIRRIQALIKDSPDLINAVNVEVTKVRSGEVMIAKNGTLLHKAASLGQLLVAKHLLEHGANVSVRDEMGRLPLHWAAENGHKAMVDLLLTNKADVNARTSGGWGRSGDAALHIAVEKGYRTVCEKLLEHGADPNAGDGAGAGPIYSAVGPGDEAILRLLLAKGANVNPSPGKKSYTPLHNATTTNIARILIEAGATVDALNQLKRSPLHVSAEAGNREVLLLLLSAGANPRLRDNNGITPLHLAAENWRPSVVAPLIAKGADPNELDASGRLPLDYLIRFNDNRPRDTSRTPQLETLEAFLAGKADPNLTGTSGIPHLYRAVDGGFDDLAETLLKAGADPNAKTTFDSSRKDYTALTRALQPGSKPRSISLVNLLLEHKADPNLADGHGNTPLYYAVGWQGLDFSEKAPFVEALLKRQVNVEAWNIDGETPLIVAVNYPMKEMVALLLKNKADPNGKSRSGSTPLHFAAVKQDGDIIELLLTAGADPNALNAEGKSPLDYVKQSGSNPQPPAARMIPSRFGTLPNFPSPPSSQPKDTAQSDIAERLRKAGARDWAPRPGLITVTRRSTGASRVIFTKGTNDWNRHSLLELMGYTYFGPDTKFPFPDLSKVTITRADSSATGGIKEFTVDLPAALAKDGCMADQWLEWGDLIDLPEGEHKLDERWSRLGIAEAGMINKCLARSVTIVVKGESNKLPLTLGSWVGTPTNGQIVYGPERPFLLRRAVLNSGFLLTSSDTTRVKVTRIEAAGGSKEWTFDLSKETSAGNDLWLRDGDRIEVPEK